MASKTEIVNRALFNIGASKRLNNVDTQTGTLAEAARALWNVDSGFVLRDFPWPWATAYAVLALVAGSVTTSANNDWRYSFRLPTDCLFARRLVVEGSTGRSNPNPPPFRIGRDSQGRLVYTNEAIAELEYTIRIDDPGEFDDMFVSMLAWKIAAGLAPSQSLIKGMATTCMEMYEIEKIKAQSRALNEGQQDVQNDAELISSRDA